MTAFLKLGYQYIGIGITLFGQEKDASTSGLARMNMILHHQPDAEIKQGNTLANPLFKNEQGQLQTFDYVVANPPFSDKRWTQGVDAGKGFIKDGNKNRLREMDVHKIVDIFNKQIEVKGYSRMTLVNEIEKNDFNLNIPRYIDSMSQKTYKI